QILGNFIGTDVSGTVPLANGGRGVSLVEATTTTIGGTTSSARNIISGNAGNGISIAFDIAKFGTKVLGNFIGTDVTGNVAVANGGTGIEVNGGAGTSIGGTAAGARNLISGNVGNGVLFTTSNGNPPSTDAQLQGNFIGTDVTGKTAL